MHQIIQPRMQMPIVYTALAIGLSLFVRSIIIPPWTTNVEVTSETSFLVWWLMSVLPVLYISFRYWVEESLDSFFGPLLLYFVLAFGIQTGLKAVMDGFDLLNVPMHAMSPFLWGLPWLAMVTLFKNSYATKNQCKRLGLILLPFVLMVYVAYKYAPLFVYLYSDQTTSAISMFFIALIFYVFSSVMLKKSKR